MDTTNLQSGQRGCSSTQSTPPLPGYATAVYVEKTGVPCIEATAVVLTCVCHYQLVQTPLTSIVYLFVIEKQLHAPALVQRCIFCLPIQFCISFIAALFCVVANSSSCVVLWHQSLLYSTYTLSLLLIASLIRSLACINCSLSMYLYVTSCTLYY